MQRGGAIIKNLIQRAGRAFDPFESLTKQLGVIMSSINDLATLQQQLATDVQTQTADIALIQNNLTSQLSDLAAAVAKLQAAQPTLDLTSITMSINQIEQNHASLLALAKTAAGIDASVIPPPAPIVSTTAPPPDQTTPPAAGGTPATPPAGGTTAAPPPADTGTSSPQAPAPTSTA